LLYTLVGASNAKGMDLMDPAQHKSAFKCLNAIFRTVVMHFLPVLNSNETSILAVAARLFQVYKYEMEGYNFTTVNDKVIIQKAEMINNSDEASGEDSD